MTGSPHRVVGRRITVPGRSGRAARSVLLARLRRDAERSRRRRGGSCAAVPDVDQRSVAMRPRRPRHRIADGLPVQVGEHLAPARVYAHETRRTAEAVPLEESKKGVNVVVAPSPDRATDRAALESSAATSSIPPGSRPLTPPFSRASILSRCVDGRPVPTRRVSRGRIGLRDRRLDDWRELGWPRLSWRHDT